jgi:hypothetical protein
MPYGPALHMVPLMWTQGYTEDEMYASELWSMLIMLCRIVVTCQILWIDELTMQSLQLLASEGWSSSTGQCLFHI